MKKFPVLRPIAVELHLPFTFLTERRTGFTSSGFTPLSSLMKLTIKTNWALPPSHIHFIDSLRSKICLNYEYGIAYLNNGFEFRPTSGKHPTNKQENIKDTTLSVAVIVLRLKQIFSCWDSVILCLMVLLFRFGRLKVLKIASVCSYLNADFCFFFRNTFNMQLNLVNKDWMNPVKIGQIWGKCKMWVCPRSLSIMSGRSDWVLFPLIQFESV